MNLRAACTLRPDDTRLAIALNLRSLTLQTGHALKTSMNLSDDEIAVIIGDTITQTLFDQSKEKLSSLMKMKIVLNLFSTHGVKTVIYQIGYIHYLQLKKWTQSFRSKRNNHSGFAITGFNH